MAGAQARELLSEDDALDGNEPLLPAPGVQPTAPQQRQVREVATEPEFVMVEGEEGDDQQDGADRGTQRQEGRLTEEEGGERTYLERQDRQQRQARSYTVEQINGMSPEQQLEAWNGMTREDKKANGRLRRVVERTKRRDHEARRHELESIVGTRDEKIKQLENEVAQLRTIAPRLNEMDTARRADELQRADQALANARAAQEAAENRLAEAVTAGDGEALKVALRARDTAFIAAVRAENQKALLAKAQPQQQQPQRDPAGDRQQQQRDVEQPEQPQQRVPQAVLRRATEFREDHDWIRASAEGRPLDDDSRIAYALDLAVIEDGYDPNTEEYWEELEDRMRTHLPHRFETTRRAAPRRQNGNGHAVTPPAPRGPGSAAPSDRGTNAGKPRGVYMSPGRKNEMMRIGVLDENGKVADSAKLQRYLRKFDEYDREHPGEVAR